MTRNFNHPEIEPKFASDDPQTTLKNKKRSLNWTQTRYLADSENKDSAEAAQLEKAAELLQSPDRSQILNDLKCRIC